MDLKIAFSPCPNDTFLFEAWVHGKVGPLPPPQVHLADIEQLNEWALSKHFDLIKVSCAAAANLMDDYAVLPTGLALGWNCGPKLLAQDPFPIAELAQKRVAIPGKTTTAHLLLQLLCPSPKEKIFLSYDRMPTLVLDGQADAALVIHEHRFTYHQLGLVEVVDLGKLWFDRYQLPIPLGCLMIHRDRCSMAQEVLSTLQASLRSPPSDERWSYVLAHSQVKDLAVVKQHIQTYVTSETHALSPLGRRSIECLFEQGNRLDLFKQNIKEWLCDC